VDVPPTQRIDYSERAELVDGVAHTGGEPRMVHLYLEPSLSAADRDALALRWHEAFGTRAWVLTRQEAVARGYFGTVSDAVLPRIGDLLVLAREGIALIDGRRSDPAAFDMVGQHGSLTRAERDIPLLTLATPRAPTRRGGGKGAGRG
jgi:hypothetical protein